MYRFYLFGAPRIERRGQTVAIDTRKALALVAYLALGDAGPGGKYNRDSLAVLLYPDSGQSSARGALRRTLSAVRKAVGNAILKTERDWVYLRLDDLWVDVLIFRQKLAQLKNHLHPSSQVCPGCLPLLQDAAALFQDGFMAGFSLRDSSIFDDWQFFQAEALRQELAGALEKFTLGLAAQGNYEAAAQQARRWLGVDPLREEAHRRLMQVYAWAGQRNAALRQYRECVRVLDQELSVSPLEETTRLYQAILENQVPPPPVLAQPSEPLLEPEPAITGSAQSITPEVQALAQDAHIKDETQRIGSFPFVGRTMEYQALSTAYAEAGKQTFVFVLEGEAGIGKTRLSHEFIAQSRHKGAQAILARCYEGETGLSYAPFLDSLSAALASPKAQVALQDLPSDAISLASQLLPGLHAHFPALPPAPVPGSPGAQVRFFDALRMVLEAILKNQSSPASGILFIDDVQWIDAASFDLLTYLVRRLKGVFVLLTCRGESVLVDHPLRQLLAQLEREGRAASLRLGRLGKQDIGALLRAVPLGVDLPENWPDKLYLETEGNPFFVNEYLGNLLKYPSGAATAPESETPPWSMPPSVRSLLQTRLHEVDEVSQQLLGTAAALGRTFDFAILREVSGRSEAEIITGLESLLQHGLILEQPPAGPESTPLGWSGGEIRYDFTHEKLRTLVYEQTSLARRRLLHQRAAEAFSLRGRGRPETLALAAYHYQLAGHFARAAAAFQQAGEVARRLYANREAISHFQSALACNHPEPALLHEAVGDLQVLMAEYQHARNSYESAAAQCPPAHLPWLEHKLGTVYHQLGDWELAECHFQTALEGLETISTSGTGRLEAVSPADQVANERAHILNDWSLTAHRRGSVDLARDLASQALKLAENSQDRSALAQAHNILGIVERASGNYPQALAHLQTSLGIAETLGDSGPRAAALNNLARLLAQNGQIDQAIQLTETALALCTQSGDRHRAAALHNNLADLLHASGEQEQAMEHLRQAVVIFSEIGGQAVSFTEAGSAEVLSPSPVDELRPEIWKLSEW
jgi:DNA-binding SARP family transcriptional activator